MKNYKESVAAIVVSYNNYTGIATTIEKLVNQVNSICIVDNASNQETIHTLRNLKSKYNNIELILLNQNVGIASALNIGVKLLIEYGYEWILTMDDDSHITNNMINQMLDDYYDLNLSEREKIASITPRILDRNLEIDDNIVENVYVNNYVLYAITSGNLVKAETFGKVGYFYEDFFIDAVDNEFCLRCHKAGLKILYSNNAILQHKLGDTLKVEFFGRQIISRNHNKIRKYYIFRNFIYFANSNIKTNFKDVRCVYRLLLKYLLGVILVESDKISKLKYITLGIYHGFKGKLGEINNEDIIR